MSVPMVFSRVDVDDALMFASRPYRVAYLVLKMKSPRLLVIV